MKIIKGAAIKINEYPKRIEYSLFYELFKQCAQAIAVLAAAVRYYPVR